MTSTIARTTYRTGFEKVYDCPAGRHILHRIQNQPPAGGRSTRDDQQEARNR